MHHKPLNNPKPNKKLLRHVRRHERYNFNKTQEQEIKGVPRSLSSLPKTKLEVRTLLRRDTLIKIDLYNIYIRGKTS